MDSTERQNGTNVTFVAVYTLVFVAGLPLNLMALVVFFCHTKYRSHTMVYMINLAVADLLLVCTLPFRIYFHWGFTSLNTNICKFAGLLLLTNMYGSIFLLTCISLDRCLAVCFPLSPHVREGRKKAPLVCLGIWVITIGTGLPIYLPISKNNKTDQICFGGFPHYATDPSAFASSITVGFGIPLVIMVLCSWGLVQAIRKSTAVQTDGDIDSRKIQRMISTNLAIFVFCFLPYHVMLAVLFSYRNHKKSGPVESAYQYSLMIACLNATLDPLAYYFTTETFRKNVDMGTVWRLWPKMNSHSSDGNSRSRAAYNSCLPVASEQCPNTVTTQS